MFSFSKKKSQPNSQTGFDYLDHKTYYFDSACQTLRPQEVITVSNKYYQEFNACGHRAKYKWAKKVDNLVEETRELLIKEVGKSTKDYTVAFCLNATAGINLVLHQLPQNNYEQIITTQVEHSSVFLPSITWAKRNNKKRTVLIRKEDGSLDYTTDNLQKSIVILNTTNNYNGQNLRSGSKLAKDVHDQSGLLLIDACQTFGHAPEILRDIDFDACFGSGHKMYGPSIGFIIIKKKLVEKMETFFIGGSTISDNGLDDYFLLDNDEEIYARLEPGLQNFAGIIGLGEAIRWKKKFKKDGLKAKDYEQKLAKYLNTKLLPLQESGLMTMLYSKPSSVVSLYPPKLDGHQLGIYLGEKNIMCRTGYHCVYYYLKNLKKYPALFRISLGLNNTEEQVDFLVDNLKLILELYK